MSRPVGIFRRWIRLASAVALAALLSASCTGGAEDLGPGANDIGASPTPGITPGPGPTSEVFDPGASVLNVAIPEPATLDPMRIADPGSTLVVRQLFEGLTSWDPVEERVVPAAAASWKALDGGRTFVFRLRPGMSFHDGEPVTAEDFEFAFDRVAQKGNASDIAYTLDKVQGFVETNQLGKRDHLSGISTLDDLTLVIKLSEPYYDFPTVLTHPGLVPVPRKRVEKIDEFLSVPVGNGPFQMAEAWSPGEPVILKSFPGFIDTPDLDGIRFLPYPDAAASWLQFVNGNLDVAEVPAGQIEDAQQRYGETGFKPFLAGYYFGFNLKAKGLSDMRLRRAINLAIDREAISSTIYRGTLAPPRGVVPEGMPGFEANLCLRLCDYSPDTAAALVDKLAAKDKKLAMDYTRGEPHDQVAKMVKEDLEAAGLDVKLRAFSFEKYLETLSDEDSAMYRLGWIAEYPLSDVFLTSLFGSSSPDNHSNYSSARVDGLLEEAHAERSDGRRVQLYKKAEEEILKSVPIAPIGSFVTHWAAQPEVQGIVFDVVGGFDAVDISLAG